MSSLLTVPVIHGSGDGESARPEWLGPYRVVAPLGRGGNGIVLRAVDAAGAAVAVKTITRMTEQGLAGLRTEIHALRRVQHRGIVRVIADGTADSWPWFAMELLEGETLAERAQRERRRAGRAWTPAELRPILELVAELCVPLARLHDSGIVHRDLKPDNVFLVGGLPVIFDLGLARQHARGDVRAAVEPSSAQGTLAYMAPEQMTRALVDARTDLFALGCILFELLVGVPPMRGVQSRPSETIGGIPAELDALVVSLLERRARDRIGHAADVRAWIARILDPAAPAAARASPWLYRPGLSGRHDVLADRLRGLERLYAGRGAFVVIEGDSGIGKTHLASEIARLASSDCLVIPAASERTGEVLACWGPLFERAVDAALVAPGAPVARAIARHTAVLRVLHPAFARVAVGAPTADPTAHTSPSADEVHLAIRDLIGALAADRPVIVLLDDVQWADELALGALALALGSWLGARRVLFLATCRTDDVAPRVLALLEQPGVERVPLGPLPTEDLRELVADMLGIGEPPDPIVAWVAERAEGNPFLAAEYLRLLADELPMTRELALPAVRVQAPTPAQLASLPRPASVRDLVMRRVRTLDAAALALAELFAVLGGAVDARVAAVLDDEHRDAMFELHRLQVVEPTADGGRRLLHDRMRAVIAEQLAEPARRALHLRGAELLRRAPAAGEPLPHAQIAHHFARAQRPEQALPHHERAAELDLTRAAYDSAVREFEDARAILADLARRGARGEPLRHVRLAHGSARASYGRGDMARTELRVRDALAVARRRLPRTRLGWVSLAVREAATRIAAPRSEGSRVFVELGLATSMLPYHYFLQEDLLPVIATALLSANLARRGSATEVATGPLSLLGAVAGLFRMPGVARRYFDEAQTAAVEARDHHEAAQAFALESIYQGSFGRWAESERAVRRALAIAEQSTDPWLRENSLTALSHVEYFTGRFDAARARGVQVEQQARDRHSAQHQIWGEWICARSEIAQGRWPAARALLEAALARLETAPEMLSAVICRGMLAEVRLAQGDAAGAEADARWVTDEIRGRLAPAYPSLVGYVATARVLRALLARAATPARRGAARDVGVSLWRFAAVYPVAVPAALVHTGALLGSPRLVALGHARAARMGMAKQTVD